MSAINYLVKNPEVPRPGIRVLFTPDEEVGRGTEHITVDQIKADYGYTLDGEKLGEIEDETFCADTVEIHITGIMVHPGYAKGKLVNAIKVASAIVDSFPKDSLSPETTEQREGYIHPFTISGGGEKVTLKAKLATREEEAKIQKKSNKLWPGLTPVKITDDIRKQLNIPVGTGKIIIGNVLQSGPADIAGIRAGDIITKINNERINSVLDFYTALNNPRERKVMFNIVRNGNELLIGLLK